MTSVTHIFVIVISVVAVGANGDHGACVSRCICRRKNLTSPLAVNCSGLVNFPLADLNTVNLSSEVSDLDISNNSLTSISTSSFRGFVRLQTLVVRWNRLALVKWGAFRGTRLSRLDLSGNSLAAIRPRTFAGVESTLVELDLSSNVIVSIEDAFVGLSALSRLDLRHNLLPGLTARSLRGLTSLRYLRLDENLIAEIDERSMADLSKLTNLALRGNPLSALTRLHFPANASLSYVDLSECSVTAVPRGVPDTVTYVQLRRNNITRLDAGSFSGASGVKILVLDENRIGEVDDGTFGHLANLNQLWLSNNRLVRVPAGLPSSLQRLMLDSNNIDRLSADSFRNLSRLNTLTLTENVITAIDVAAFRSLSTLAHLDLSANKINSVSAGLFASNARLDTLLLSRNPLQFLDAGSFLGLPRLRTLSLSFVRTRVCIDEDAFRPLSQLTSLDLDSSQWLAATIMGSSALCRPLASIRHLSLQRTDLTRLRSSLFSTFFPVVESVRLSGGAWVCDEDLMWLRDWLMTSPLASDLDRQVNRCAAPPPLAGRLVFSVDDREFKRPPDHPPSYSRTHPRTENGNIIRQNVDTDCSRRSRTTSDVAMVTTSALSSQIAILRSRKTTPRASLTSQLRHGDVTNDVGLVQVILIVCTLAVTFVLAAVIIAVIVRLTRRRHPDDDVTSDLTLAGHVTGSRVSVRHCPPEDVVADGWRCRASSTSCGGNKGAGGGSGSGGRVADYQRRQPAGRRPVCDDVSDKLVNEVAVERLLTDGAGTRLTDEQWRRMYTWEDT